MIKKHLKKCIDISSGLQRLYFEWMLEEGRSFKEGRPPVYHGEVNKKECFRNSLLATFSGFGYAEGYYVTEFGMPFQHAWNFKEDKAIDFTTDKFNIKAKERFGVIVPENVRGEYLESDQAFTLLQFYFIEVVVKREKYKPYFEWVSAQHKKSDK